MKNLISLLYILILSSCSSTLTIINKTDREIEVISVLNETDRSNFDLGFKEIKTKNILDKNLLPGKKIQIEKIDNISIIAMEEYQYYYTGNLKGNKLKIEPSLKLDTDDFVPMVAPDNIRINIKNDSKFYIQEVKMVIQDQCGPNKIRTIDAMKAWNLILPGSEIVINFEYYPPCPYILKEICINGFLGNDIIEKKYISDLKHIIITDE